MSSPIAKLRESTDVLDKNVQDNTIRSNDTKDHITCLKGRIATMKSEMQEMKSIMEELICCPNKSEELMRQFEVSDQSA